jgi:hypothetical protein
LCHVMSRVTDPCTQREEVEEERERMKYSNRNHNALPRVTPRDKGPVRLPITWPPPWLSPPEVEAEGGRDDDGPGRPLPARAWAHAAASLSIDRWLAWSRLTDRMMPEGADVTEILRVQEQAYRSIIAKPLTSA